MSNAQVSMVRRRNRRIFIFIGLVVVLVIVVLLAVVLALKLGNSSSAQNNFKATVIGKCETFLRNHENTSRLNDCNTIWEAFEQAYVGKDPCDVPPEAYDPLITSVTETVNCGTMLFWSKTKTVVHAFTDKRDCLATLEDTLIGFIFDELNWCSKNNSKETYVTDCPEWSECQNNPVRSFWIRASINFAATSCGNVSAMLNGSLASPFSPDSIFGSVEVKNLDPDKVQALTILLVIKDTDTSSCNSSSFQSLQSALDPNIAYNCREVPYGKVENCISYPEIPCGDCL